jgi:hypothetical protein
MRGPENNGGNDVRYFDTIDDLIRAWGPNGVVYNTQNNIDVLTRPDASVQVVQAVLDRNWQLAKDPQVRAAMREKKGRPPISPQQA